MLSVFNLFLMVQDMGNITITFFGGWGGGVWKRLWVTPLIPPELNRIISLEPERR